MQIILFSRNRGCQLELLLRSMKKYFVNLEKNKVNILYKYDTEEFAKGYEITMGIHPEFNYVHQTGKFSTHLVKLFDLSHPYTCFGVDDNVFKESFDIDSVQFNLFAVNTDIVTVSLRLNKKLNYCYPARVQMTPPDFGEYNLFKWKGLPGDYGYPMSLDFHIFKTNEIVYYIYSEHLYNCPNSLESIMAMRPIDKPYMLCYDKSPVMNLPINKVQTFNNNVHGNISAEYINSEYLNGSRISLENISGFNNRSCHQELPIRFEKINS